VQALHLWITLQYNSIACGHRSAPNGYLQR